MYIDSLPTPLWTNVHKSVIIFVALNPVFIQPVNGKVYGCLIHSFWAVEVFEQVPILIS